MIRVRGTYDKYFVKYIYINVILFTVGIILGTCYCVYLKESNNREITTYISDYFKNIDNMGNSSIILKNSLIGTVKIFLLIFLSSFVRIGSSVISCCVILKGFVFGFSAASFIKCFGVCGLLFPVSEILQNIIYVPTLIFFSSKAMDFSINRQKNENKKNIGYISLAFCCLTIFCMVSFFEAYVSTIFMKLISGFFV